MSKENENKLIVVERSLAALASNPAAQIEIARKINTKVYEVFEIDRLLNELNTRLFEGKGEIKPLSHRASIKPETSQDSENRFKKLFTLGYQAQETALGAELYIKKGSGLKASESKHFESVGIKVYQVVNIQDEALAIHILGKLYFSIGRSGSGRWNDSPTFLEMQSQGRVLSFSLHSIPLADEVRRAFWENIAQILGDLSAGNFIPPTELENNKSLEGEETKTI